MAPLAYTKHTWANEAAGATPITATKMGEIDTGIFDAHFRARGAIVAGTIPLVATGGVIELGTTATYTAMTWTEEYDSEGWHPGASMNAGNVRIGVAGVYLLTAYVGWPPSNTTGIRYLSVYINGTTVNDKRRYPAAVDYTEVTFFTPALCAVGDRFGMALYQTSGGNITPSYARMSWTHLSF